MAQHAAALDPLIVLFGVAVAVVIFYYLIRWIRHTLGHLGLTPGEIAVIIWATLVGSLINIPLMRFGEGFLGINVGGAIVPIVLSAYLIRRKGLPLNEVLVGILLVAFVSFMVTTYDPEIGVYATFPWWLLPPFTAFLVAAFAYWHESPHSAALAYVSGTLGTLIGADIVRLPQILGGPPPAEGVMLSIGGAGVFDMVFLAGILAVTMEAGLLARTREDLVSQRSHNPIEAEYQQWIRRKEKESQEIRAQYRRLTERREDPRAQVRRQMEEYRRQQAPEPAAARAKERETRESRERARPSATGARHRERYRSRYQPRYRPGSRPSASRERRFTPSSGRAGTGSRREGRETGAQARDRDRRKRRDDERSRRQDERARGGRREEPRGESWRAVREQGRTARKRGGRGDEEGREEEPSLEGPRPPPRQPRPASGTKRVPASHRARGLYR